MKPSQYFQVYPTFWIGPTGRAIQKGGPLAQLMALYLMTSPHANMAGLYYLPTAYIQSDTGLDEGQTGTAIEALEQIGFAKYDWAAGWVFVAQMVRFQVGEKLHEKDKRCGKLVEILANCPCNDLVEGWLVAHSDLVVGQSIREMVAGKSKKAHSSGTQGPLKGH